MTKKRKKIVNEIIESEKSYQHHLQLLITVSSFIEYNYLLGVLVAQNSCI